MFLADKLSEILREEGITALHIDKSTLYKLRDSRTDYLQWLGVMLLEGKVKICRDELRGGSVVYESRGVKILHGQGQEYSDTYILWASKQCKNVDLTAKLREKLSQILPTLREKLLFIIDVSFWHEHTEIEKNELIEQIVLTLKTVRKYLHDVCLVVTSCCDEFLEYFNRATAGMKHSVKLTRLSLRDFLKRELKFRGRVAVLDPEGDRVLTETEISSYNVYVMGGIIDKERVDKFGTYRLYNLHRLWEFNIPRFKIVIGDSIIGVPDRLNKIAEIIIAVKLYGKKLEEAIIEQQSKRDRIYRWMYEIQKFGQKLREDNKMVYIVTREFIEYLKRRYPIDEKSIDKIFKSLNVRLQG